MNSELFGMVFPFFFVGMWLLVLAILGTMGWSGLARRFPADERPTDGRAVWGTSLRMGSFAGTSYGGCVNLRVGSSGIRFSVWLPFRPFHPPIFLPWSAVESCEERRILFLRRVVIHLYDAPRQIVVQGRGASAVLEAWHAPRTAGPARGAIHPAAPRDESFGGVRILVLLSAICSVVLLVSAVAGIPMMAVTRNEEAGRLVAVALAVLHGGFAYGVHRRVPLAWWGGFVVLAVNTLPMLRLIASGELPVPMRVFPVLGMIGVLAYWGTWWKQQRGYFGI